MQISGLIGEIVPKSTVRYVLLVIIAFPCSATANLIEFICMCMHECVTAQGFGASCHAFSIKSLASHMPNKKRSRLGKETLSRGMSMARAKLTSLPQAQWLVLSRPTEGRKLLLAHVPRLAAKTTLN